MKIGIDTVYLPRFARAMTRWGDKIKHRLFTREELDSCQGTDQHQIRCLAAVFAAKEAFLKALGTGLAVGIKWQDVQVLRDPRGAPYYLISGRAQQLLTGPTALSMTHDGDYAVAVCIIQEEES